MITTVAVEGMTCQHCVRAVFTALAAVSGIDRAEVSIGSARVEHDGSVTVDQIQSGTITPLVVVLPPASLAVKALG